MPTSKWTQEAYIKAFRFAARAHSGQTMPGTGLPYLAHLSMVAMEVMAALAFEGGLDGDLGIQCALLHDVIEDTGTTFERIREEFGATVAQGVLALSKDAGLIESERLGDSLRRIQLQPREVWMVKLADRITNLQAPPSHWSREKIIAYRREAVEILEKLGETSHLLAERLAEKIQQYERFVSQRSIMPGAPRDWPGTSGAS
jgi:guanosine-3',5'-bis(diphosphate) 3'-pyrophosphohydrolase